MFDGQTNYYVNVEDSQKFLKFKCIATAILVQIIKLKNSLLGLRFLKASVTEGFIIISFTGPIYREPRVNFRYHFHSHFVQQKNNCLY